MTANPPLPRRVALVTGAAGGIGAAIAQLLAQQGMDLALLDLVEPPLALRQSLQAAGARYAFAQGDLGNPEEAWRLVEMLVAELGPIDCLVNNAGLTRHVAPVTRIKNHFWQRELATNLSGPLYLMQAVLPSMVARGWGRIVNISSMAARAGLYHQAGYSATKTALLGLTRNVALEHARDGITCNAVLPGLIATEAVRAMPPAIVAETVSLVPARRLGSPQEVAALVGFLSSDEAAFINGAEIDVGGGAHLCPIVLGSLRELNERHAFVAAWPGVSGVPS